MSISSAVVARLDRATQYAAAARLKHWRLWNTGSPGQAGRWHRDHSWTSVRRVGKAQRADHSRL